MNKIICPLLAATLTSVICCKPFNAPPKPVYPDREIYGPDGPEPMRGWESETLNGIICSGNYYDTGGDWYIIIEHHDFLKSKYTQLYTSPVNKDGSVTNWDLVKNFQVSDRFLYIQDPMRVYNGWHYRIFIYLDYTGEE